MKKYTHLVFDIDGTIVDSLQVHMKSLRDTLKDVMGRDYSEEELKFTFGIPGMDTMCQLGVPDPKKAFDAWVERYVKDVDEMGLPLFPGMQEVLNELQKKEVSLGIATSKVREEYDEQFARNGLISMFPMVITASDTPKGKPNPDPMLAYLAKTGAAKDEVLFFGDTKYDMACAKGAGVDCALVLWGCMNPDGVEADYKLAKPEEILDFV